MRKIAKSPISPHNWYTYIPSFPHRKASYSRVQCLLPTESFPGQVALEILVLPYSQTNTDEEMLRIIVEQITGGKCKTDTVMTLNIFKIS